MSTGTLTSPKVNVPDQKGRADRATPSPGFVDRLRDDFFLAAMIQV